MDFQAIWLVILHSRPVVILFARAPRLGMVKRRLAAEIGDVAALRFHRNMLAATLRKLQRLRGVEKILLTAPDGAFIRHPPGWVQLPQGHGGLGARMQEAFNRWRRRQVILVGADIPGLRAQDVRDAAKALKYGDAVFGPAADGGYYLIGMGRKRPARCFADVRWSSADALADTLKNFGNCRVRFVAMRHDVDTAADLIFL